MQVNDTTTATMSNNYNANQPGQLNRAGTGPTKIADRLVDAKDVQSSFAKDLNGFVYKITDGKGQNTEIKRNQFGSPTEVTFADNSKVQMTYDSITNDLLSTKDVNTNITESTTYDSYGNILSKTDGLGRVQAKAYNQQGLLTAETNPGNILTTYTYNSKGQVLTKTIYPSNASPQTTTYAYNALSQLQSVTSHDGKSVSYLYDLAGNMIRSTSLIIGGI
jgi:YD repeat-containing protein